MIKLLRAAVCALALGAAATALPARPYVFHSAQSVTAPPPFLGVTHAAVSGNDLVVLARRQGGGGALLFEYTAANGWRFARVLVDQDGADNGHVSIQGGIAAFVVAGTLHVFEKGSAGWAAAPLGGDQGVPDGSVVDVDRQRILVGNHECRAESRVLERDASRTWRYSQRIPGGARPCGVSEISQADLSGVYALSWHDGLGVYAQDGSNLDWARVATLAAPPATNRGPAHALSGPRALLASIDGTLDFERTVGTNVFPQVATIRPLDWGLGTGYAGSLAIRSGLVFSTETPRTQVPLPNVYVYRGRSDRQFDHVATLLNDEEAYLRNVDYDNGHAVAPGIDYAGDERVWTWRLPADLTVPEPQRLDLESGPVSMFQVTAGSYAVRFVGDPPSYVYRQSSLAGDSRAVIADADRIRNQSIEADIIPRAVQGSDRWIGLGLRYRDAANHYYVTLRSSNVLALRRMLNGSYVTLRQVTLPFALDRRYHVRLQVVENLLTVDVDGREVIRIADAAASGALATGRTALLGYRTSADYDNIVVSGARVTLADKIWDADNYFLGHGFTTEGGNWEITGDADPEAYSQLTPTGDARALLGAVTDDQVVETRVRIDQFPANAPNQQSWVGALARYVDGRTHYYLTLRSSNAVQLRKQVNGVITVLDSVPLTVTPGREYTLKLVAVGNQLRGYVDGRFLLESQDNSIARGTAGLGMYRAAASYRYYRVTQP